MMFCNLYKKNSSIGSGAPLLVLLAFCAAVLGCSEEAPERKPQLLPVAAFDSRGFSLESTEESCASLKEFVTEFSKQYVPGIYQDVSCSELKAKLTFSVRNPGKISEVLGTVVVYQMGRQARFLICSPATVSLTESSVTHCSDAGSGSNTKFVPANMKTNGTRVQDFMFTLADYLLR